MAVGEVARVALAYRPFTEVSHVETSEKERNLKKKEEEKTK
jgi:hypothetical protein